ncbi:hypothetical protein TNCV_5032891 [Trichonephila clavipes]|nr:hypothetical protein TNCV_5032891 [Trichonephila clavipes]
MMVIKSVEAKTSPHWIPGVGEPLAGLKLTSSKQRWLDGAPKVPFWLWNHYHFQTNGIVTRKVSQGHHKATTSAQDHYVALSARQHRQTTAPQLARDLLLRPEEEYPGKLLTDVLKKLAFMSSGIQSPGSLVCPFDCIQQKRSVIEEPKASVVDTTRIGSCSFQSRFTRQS